MHLPTAGFIQHTDLYSVSKTSEAIYHDHIYILDEAIVTDTIVGNIVLNILNHYIVSHSAIMKHRMADAGMFLQSPGKMKLLVKKSQLNLS